MTTAVMEVPARAIGGKTEEKLVSLFFVLYKNARIVDKSNPAFKRQCINFHELLQGLCVESDEVAIKIIAGRYFVNQKLVRFGEQGLSGAAVTVAEWQTLGLAGVRFMPGVTLKEIEHLFNFVGGIKPTAQNRDQLSEALKAYRQPSIRFFSAHELAAEAPAVTEEIRRQFRTAARATFFRAMSTVEDNMASVAQGKDIDISRTKRVIRSLIDHITKDEQSLIELAAIKNFDDYTYAHSTNVCVYALTLGVRLGFDRARLSQLGFAALFHDIGKVKLPTDLIRKPDAYDENDWIQMQRHPLLGAKTILRNLKLDSHTARAARVALEHHINADFTGYPTLRYEKRRNNLFSQIVSIVDTFDALSSGRVYLKKPIPPDKVLQKMHYQMTVKFDSLLLKIFTDIVGIYPAGTLVLLTTDELALVLTNNESDKARPFVKIIGNRQGPLATTQWVDLSATEHGHRKIVRMVDPSRYGLDIKEFILAD
ncbi:MAG TPA: HD domain-containing phosphohydrolase [Candidatus Deferrimicrobium sp.]|nr:HD domain-containing phosphohydrolase [Candidatus Deferrimicrobium sp.]